MEDQEVSSEGTDDTPVVEESAPQAESEGAETQAAPPEEKKEEPQIPFHEHPRFKELIEERRAFKEQLDQAKGYMDAMQKEMQSLRQPIPVSKPESKYKQLLEQVKQVNPEFAQFQEQMLQDLEDAKKEAAVGKEVKQRLEQYELREEQSRNYNRFQTLLDQNKVPEALKTRYEREVRALAINEEAQGKRLTAKDVDRLFKSVHDDYSAFLEGYKRDQLKGYVKEKAGDAPPATATGGAAVSSKAKKLPSLDTPEGMRQVTDLLAKEMRAAKKI